MGALSVNKQQIASSCAMGHRDNWAKMRQLGSCSNSSFKLCLFAVLLLSKRRVSRFCNIAMHLNAEARIWRTLPLELPAAHSQN